MARMRFNAAEKALLASTQELDWQNVTQWHPAGRVPGAEIQQDGKWQYVEALTATAKGTGRAGDTIRLTPGHVRARA